MAWVWRWLACFFLGDVWDGMGRGRGRGFIEVVGGWGEGEEREGNMNEKKKRRDDAVSWHWISGMNAKVQWRLGA